MHRIKWLKSFGDLHEEIQDLLSGEELTQDHQVQVVREWMANAEQQKELNQVQCEI